MSNLIYLNESDKKYQEGRFGQYQCGSVQHWAVV
jgi:hypothetical protein